MTISRDAIRQVLGFFIGEPPVNPLDPALIHHTTCHYPTGSATMASPLAPVCFTALPMQPDKL